MKVNCVFGHNFNADTLNEYTRQLTNRERIFYVRAGPNAKISLKTATLTVKYHCWRKKAVISRFLDSNDSQPWKFQFSQ